MTRKEVKMSPIEKLIRQMIFFARGFVKRMFLHIKYNGEFSRNKKIKHAEIDFKYTVSIVAVFKNEADYLDEWVRYHQLIGIEHFYLVNNNSTDDYKKVLEKFVDDGTVTLIDLPDKNAQMKAYQLVMERFSQETTWLAIIDIDEFIVMVDKSVKLPEFLNKFGEEVSQIIVGWMIFGSSGHIKKLEGGVLDRFRLHSTDDFIADYKAIVKPSMMLDVPSPHWVNVTGITVDEQGRKYYQYPRHNVKIAKPASKKIIRINHYYSKSLEEFQSKSLRGFADKDRIRRSEADFLEHDQNLEKDDLVDRYIEIMKHQSFSNEIDRNTRIL